MPRNPRAAQPRTTTPHLARTALALADRQSGVIGRSQLTELGVPSATITSWIAAGHFEASGRWVLVVSGTAMGPLRLALEAGQHVGAAGSLTGPSAAAVRGQLESPPWDAVDFVPKPWVRTSRHIRVDGTILRKAPLRPAQIKGVLVEPPHVALIDALRWLPQAEAREMALRLPMAMKKVVALTMITEALAAEPRSRGSRQLRDIAVGLESGAWSEPEFDAARCLREAGFTGFIPNYPVVIDGRQIVIDIAFPDAMLAIEIDGRIYHAGAARTAADMHRQNALIGAGWRVLRFGWADVQNPEKMLLAIARALGEAD